MKFIVVDQTNADRFGKQFVLDYDPRVVKTQLDALEVVVAKVVNENGTFKEPYLTTWFQDYNDRVDAKEAADAETARLVQVKTDALAKLSDDELKALGIDRAIAVIAAAELIEVKP